MKRRFLIPLLLLLPSTGIVAQICTNSTDTVYGLTAVANASPTIAMGQIVGINLNNAGAVAIGAPSASANSANAVGFSQVNGRFYYFNQVGSGTIEFVSYDPLTGTKQVLSNPPLLPTNQRIRSGTVNKDGTGYYMIYPAASTAQGYPKTGPALYFYNIPLNTWTLLTQDFLNSSGTNVANIITLNSGDMAFDGSDNLWLLCSSTSNHALYKIDAPLPTAAVASVAVDTMIAQRANPVAGVSFTGICFNFTGNMYLTTGSGAGAGNNRLYRLPSTSSPFTLIGTVPNSYGDDLTSCVFPVGVLSVNWLNYRVRLSGSRVLHQWDLNNGPEQYQRFDLQFSLDGIHWEHTDADIGPTRKEEAIYHYTAFSSIPNAATVYYRIRAIDQYGKEQFSPVRNLAIPQAEATITVFPNPVQTAVQISSPNLKGEGLYKLLDLSGNLLLNGVFHPAGTGIDMSRLPAGVYILHIVSASGYVARPVKVFKTP